MVMADPNSTANQTIWTLSGGAAILWPIIVAVILYSPV
jgi:hypothetical protein